MNPFGSEYIDKILISPVRQNNRPKIMATIIDMGILSGLMC